MKKIVFDPTINWDTKPTEEEMIIIKKVLEGIIEAEMFSQKYVLTDCNIKVVLNAYKEGYVVQSRYEIGLEEE